MPTEILFTALPDGRTPDVLRLSVHVQPRLTPPSDTTLASFPPLDAWPPSDLAFDVEVGGVTIRATTVSVPDPSLYTALFPPTTRVAAHEVPDLTQTSIHSYPVAAVMDWLEDQYATWGATSPEEFPAITDLLASGFEGIRFSGLDGRRTWDEAMEQLDARLQGQQHFDAGPAGDGPTLDFIRVEDFFAPSDLTDPQVKAAFDTPPAKPEPDYHQAVAYVQHHPKLQRILGLVIDIEIPAERIPDGQTTVSVTPVSPAIDPTTTKLPATHCEVGRSTFRAVTRPTTHDMADGLLTLEEPAFYRVVPVDVDGAAIKAVDFAGNLKRRQLKPTSDTPTEAALPSLRAGGLSVARVQRAKALHDKLVQSQAMNADVATDSLQLWAEDVVRGYRVDVFDERSKQWHSLMRRTGTYDFPDVPTTIPVEDEGILTNTPTMKPGRSDLYQQEEICTWDGWSLVAPRPSKMLKHRPDFDEPATDQTPNTPEDDFRIGINHAVTPGTLPRLRYGNAYRFRIRTVDLAGNSVAFGDPFGDDFTHATPPVVYGRFQPAQTPPVLLRTPRGPGESMEHVVLRSNHDVAPSPATAERHLVPAKVGQLTVEEHALLDTDQNGANVLDKAAYQLLVELDDANLLDLDDGDADPDEFADTRHYDTDALPITYAPDPLGRGLAFRIVAGPNTGHLERIPFHDAQPWPHAQAVRLVVVEDTGTPSFDPSTRVLRVPLEKAYELDVRLSAYLHDSDLALHGVWGWIAGKNPPNLNDLANLATTGQHWMLTPFRMLKLVHAVRQPLATPEFDDPPAVSRTYGATFAQLRGDLLLDRRSTAKIDVLAGWSEPVDEGTGSGPPDTAAPFSRTVADDTAFVVDIEQGDQLDPTTQQYLGRHEFGDTRHRVVTYHGVATSRFTEYFTDKDTFPFGGPGDVVVLPTGGKGVVAGTVRITQQLEDGTTKPLVEGEEPLSEGEDFSVQADLGQITFAGDPNDPDANDLDLPDPGDPVTATYLVPPVTRVTADPPDGNGAQTLHVPSSARPAAPRVRYALPTFAWDAEPVRNEAGETVGTNSERHGHGVRVYLDRPWWSSGEGELLGVLTWPGAERLLQSDLPPGDPMQGYVTQWGDDPVHLAGTLPVRYPRLAHFPAAVGTAKGRTLEERDNDPDPSQLVNVAGHTVGYDADRDLWYCDIAIDKGDTHMPFVRLALARYQPHSIGNAHLSRVVLAEFLQLASDRFASVVRDDAAPNIFAVSVTGPAHRRTEVTKGDDPGPAHVLVEQRDPKVPGDLGWKQVGDAIPLTGAVDSSGMASWFGEVHLDEAPAPDQVRLVIEQYDLLGDETAADETIANPFLPGTTTRLVYSDIIPL